MTHHPVLLPRDLAPGRHLLAALPVLLLACKPAAPPTPPSTLPAQPAEPTPATPRALRGPVVSLEITGLTGDRQLRASGALTTAVGATYDPDDLAADIRALWRLHGIADIQVDARPVDGGVALRYRVREHPRVRKLDFQGGPALYLDTWRTRFAANRDTTFDPAVLSQLVDSMRADFADHGFLDAVVTWKKLDVAADQIDIVIATDAGPQVKLGALELRGNKTLKTAELQQILRKRGVAVGQPFPRTALDAARADILDRYREIGHINAELTAVDETRTPGAPELTLTVTITEHPQFRLGKLVIRGAPDETEVRRLLGLREGEIFNQTKVRAGLDKLRTWTQTRGSPEPGITVKKLDTKTRKIDLDLDFPAK